MKILSCSIITTLLVMISLPVTSQTVYVTDNFQIGLHAEKTLASPIVSVIPAGTPLELVKREERLSYVRDPGGVGGWIDNSYLSENTLASEQLQAAQARIASLEQSLENSDSSDKTDTPAITEEQLIQLEGLLEDERKKAETLQKQVAEMEHQLTSSDPDSLYIKIEQLSTENTHLQDQLATLIERPAPGTVPVQRSSSSDDEMSSTSRYVLTLLIAAIIGLGLGMYIMDLSNRRRHGGFRVRV